SLNHKSDAVGSDVGQLYIFLAIVFGLFDQGNREGFSPIGRHFDYHIGRIDQAGVGSGDVPLDFGQRAGEQLIRGVVWKIDEERSRGTGAFEADRFLRDTSSIGVVVPDGQSKGQIAVVGRKYF